MAVVVAVVEVVEVVVVEVMVEVVAAHPHLLHVTKSQERLIARGTLTPPSNAACRAPFTSSSQVETRRLI